jgi:cell division protein FtsL
MDENEINIESKAVPNEGQVTNPRENITKYLPFVLFLSAVLLVYIFFTHRTERKVRKIEKLNKEVKELYSEYITLQTELLNGSRSSNLESKMLNKGIKPSDKTPIVIK